VERAQAKRQPMTSDRWLLAMRQQYVRLPMLGSNDLRSTNLSFYARRGLSESLREPHATGGEIVYMKSVER
jgi:hypothetical protein